MGSFGSATLEKTEASRGQDGPPRPRLSSPRESLPPHASPAADAHLGLAGSPMPAGHSQLCPWSKCRAGPMVRVAWPGTVVVPLGLGESWLLIGTGGCAGGAGGTWGCG